MTLDIDYLLEVAWRDTGAYKYLFDPDDNLTGDVMSVEAMRGRDFDSAVGRWTPGQLSALLRNDDGKYSPNNAGSPLSGYLKTNRPIALSAGLRESSLAAKFVAANTRYLTHVDHAALSVGDIYWDMVVWVKVVTPGNTQGIVFKGVDLVAGSDYEYALYTNGSKFTFIVRDVAHTANAEVVATTFGNIPANTLCMVHMYHDPTANEIGISVNVGAHDTQATAGGIRDSTAAFQVGRMVLNTVSYWHDGATGPIAIWKPTGTNLTADQLTWLYNGGYGRDRSELGVSETDGQYLAYDVAGNFILYPWWQLDEVSGTRADSWLLHLSLTESGGAISSEAGLDTKVYRGLWAGTIDAITPSVSTVGALHVSTLKCQGPLSALAAAKKLDLPVDVAWVGLWIRAILYAYWDAFYTVYDWDTGKTKTGIFYPANDATGLELCRQMEDTEPGLLYEFLSTRTNSSRHFIAEGFLYGFTDRWHRLTATRSLTSQATFSDSGADLPITGVEQLDPLGGIYNSVQVFIQGPDIETSAVPGVPDVLWTDTSLCVGTHGRAVLCGESIQVIAKYPTESQGSLAAAYVNPWTTPVVGTDIISSIPAQNAWLTVTDVVKSATEMTFTVNCSAPHPPSYVRLTTLRARGIPYGKGPAMPVAREDAASIVSYGLRVYPLPPKWLGEDAEDAENFCDYIISRYKDPHDRLRLTFVASKSDAAMCQALAGQVGDRITIDADDFSGLGIADDFYIENIHHAIDMGKTRHIVTYELVSCSGEGAYWIVEHSASALGTTTRLEY
ncbi:MAG TPA: hypothetical protein VMW79_06165 [Anaerolineae bacterium]|nr:hypothetical protein [Anaerolineae bacterium]HUW95981.1 hypothetical protein [Anaerolineae bacterium]